MRLAIFLVIIGGIILLALRRFRGANGKFWVDEAGNLRNPDGSVADYAGPPIPAPTNPKSTMGTIGSAVDRCHKTVQAGSAAVLTKYGVPSSLGAASAKGNIFYWYCDAGGYVAKAGAIITTPAKSLYKSTLGKLF